MLSSLAVLDFEATRIRWALAFVEKREPCSAAYVRHSRKKTNGMCVKVMRLQCNRLNL